MTITQKEKPKNQFDTKRIEINFTCNHNLCTHDHNKAKTWIFFLETKFFFNIRLQFLETTTITQKINFNFLNNWIFFTCNQNLCKCNHILQRTKKNLEWFLIIKFSVLSNHNLWGLPSQLGEKKEKEKRTSFVLIIEI